MLQRYNSRRLQQHIMDKADLEKDKKLL
ncbi:MAG: hypothetical protein US59_C0008G0041, partial [Candidatus Levybacteria bacterium GW2011_GWB1_37_8]